MNLKENPYIFSLIFCCMVTLAFVGILFINNVHLKMDTEVKRETPKQDRFGGGLKSGIGLSRADTTRTSGHRNSNNNNNNNSLTRVRRYGAYRTDPFQHVFECSKGAHSLADMVVGGAEAQPFSQPWMALVRARFPQKFMTQVCGGTVISAQWVLTAAHCFEKDGDFAKTGKVIVGLHDARTVREDKALSLPIQKGYAFIHEDFVLEHLINDLTLIKLPIVIPSTRPHIRRACLLLSGKGPDIGTECVASGWGSTVGGNRQLLSKVLLTIKVVVTSCGVDKQFGPDVICTSRPPSILEDQDTCKGDSGGPLIWIRNGVPMVVGVLSSGSSACTGDPRMSPAVYIRVTSHFRWMKKIIKDHDNGDDARGPSGPVCWE